MNQSGCLCPCKADNGLLLACIPPIGLLWFAWQQLGTHLMVVGAGWLHTVPRRRSGRALSTVTGVRIW